MSAKVFFASPKREPIALLIRGTASSQIVSGKDGEWTKSQMLQVQYHDVTDAANLDTWRGMSYQTVITPEEEKTGNLIYPYAKALG